MATTGTATEVVNLTNQKFQKTSLKPEHSKTKSCEELPALERIAGKEQVSTDLKWTHCVNGEKLLPKFQSHRICNIFLMLAEWGTTDTKFLGAP